MELLDDVKVDEDQLRKEDKSEKNKIYDDDNFIDEFIKRLDHIKVEKN